jgi:hypothetical protein
MVFSTLGNPWLVSREKEIYPEHAPRNLGAGSHPSLDKRKWPQEIDLSWLSACYAHFGCASYWEYPTVTGEHIIDTGNFVLSN